MAPYPINGILNLNKPAGNTSFQAVAAIRRLSGVRKVGHSGTLDPDATGVLPILIGQATRLASFLTNASKTYLAQVEFGRATSTCDASGETEWTGDIARLSRQVIEEALQGFEGSIEQVPPMYSAIKYRGEPLYKLARKGVKVDRKPREVEISRLEIRDWRKPVLELEIDCGKGTYIRSLAHDLGNELGCGGHLKRLVRLRSGPFHIDQSVSMEQAEAGFKECSWESLIYPMDMIVSHLGRITVSPEAEREISCGRAIRSIEDEDTGEYELCRAYSEDGRFLGLVRFGRETGVWHPEKVFI